MTPEHITWAGVIYTLIITVPAIISAYAGLRNRRALKTGNDKTPGEMITELHGEASKQQTEYDTHR